MQADLTCPYNSEANLMFPSKNYLKRFVDPTSDPMNIHVKFLEAFHYFYQKYTGDGEKMAHLLEFGGGPTLYSLITASKHVETISFADYAESNRNEITSWMDKMDGHHNWSPYFKHVVTELEKNCSNGVTEQREDELRQKIREIIPCNIRNENVIESTRFVPFDIIQSNLCLETACESKDEFTKCLRSLKGLLRSGGYVVTLTAKGGSWYTCAGAGQKLHQLKMEEGDLIQAFKEAGFKMCEFFSIEPKQNFISATRNFQFTIAQKL